MQRFKEFANAVIEESFEGGSLDGGQLQEMALEHGLLRELEVQVPCGDDCRCAEYGDFPMICMRKTYEGDREG